MSPLLSDPRFVEHSLSLWHSFKEKTGSALLPLPAESSAAVIAQALYQAPFVLVSHDTAVDPVFNYANLKAQDLWKLTWKDFTQLPSRYSAEPMNREERQELLDQAARQGYISGYKGVRISAEGERFSIKDTILWNVSDQSGRLIGQAATFAQWDWL